MIHHTKLKLNQNLKLNHSLIHLAVLGSGRSLQSLFVSLTSVKSCSAFRQSKNFVMPSLSDVGTPWKQHLGRVVEVPFLVRKGWIGGRCSNPC